MRDWKNLLKKMGFTEGEAAVYLAALEMGSASVQDIAKKAGVSRVTTYAALERLLDQGLMATSNRGKRARFHAEPPKRLVEVIGRRVALMDAGLKDVRDSLDELSLVQGGEKPVVKVFEGPEALQVLQDDILAKKPKNIDSFSNINAVRALYTPESRKDFFDKMKKIKTKSRTVGILPNDILSSSDDPTVVRLDSGKEFWGDINVYENTIAISALRGKQFSVFIESKDLADTMRIFFDAIFSKK